MPIAGSRFADRLIARLGPGFSDQIFFWDDNLYNAAGSFKALCEAILPLRRPWSAEMTMDVAEKPELLKLAYDSGCRNLFLGIESVSQTAIDGLDKWSNDTSSMRENVKRVHDAGINIMGAFVFGLDGDDTESTVPAEARTFDLVFSSVSAGFGHTCGVTSDGAVYCWGRNLAGQLGDGTRNNARRPTRVSGT